MSILFDAMITEKRNEQSLSIGGASTLEMLHIINEQDKLVAVAVERELPTLAAAIDAIAPRIRQGGRLIYCGAGTSGRLGVLDAVECPPTYGVDDNLVVGLIAGGYNAMFKAQEGAEDSFALCQKELEAVDFNAKDTLVGVAASGRTPYVIGGIRYAKSIQALTISLCCNPDSEMSHLADFSIAPVVGPEVITGSTRMKAGSAQKMVLNMLSTGVMISLGKVYENLMVDLRPTNEKLRERSRHIVMDAAGVDYRQAAEVLEHTQYDVKASILVLKTGCNYQHALLVLGQNDGQLHKALSCI